MDSLHDAARRPLLDAAGEISGALVYLDAGAAEVAQLSWGPEFLFGESMLLSCREPICVVGAALRRLWCARARARAPCAHCYCCCCTCVRCAGLRFSLHKKSVEKEKRGRGQAGGAWGAC